jgi:hypothetical protein
MALTQLYVGASTPFGTIVLVSPRLYNAEAIVRAKDGSSRTYQLPHLIALGVHPTHLWHNAEMSFDPNKMYSGVSDSERMYQKEEDGTISVYRRAAKESPYEWEIVERGPTEAIRAAYDLPQEWVDQ